MRWGEENKKDQIANFVVTCISAIQRFALSLGT